MCRPPAALLSLLSPLLALLLLMPAAEATTRSDSNGHPPQSPSTSLRHDSVHRTDASPRRRAAASKRLKRVYALVNKARSQPRTCGDKRYGAVRRVKRHARLDRAAGKHATQMAREDFFSHVGPDGSDPGVRIKREGYRWSTYGENIAAGQTTPASVVKAWLESPGHCVIIMSRFAELGVGYAYDPDAYYQRYWVLDFASRR